MSSTLRQATKNDCQPGAVFERDGKLWDVVKAPTAGLSWEAKIADDYGNERAITQGVLTYYKVVREPPRFDAELEAVASLPELEADTDQLRRAGILANLETA